MEKQKALLTETAMSRACSGEISKDSTKYSYNEHLKNLERFLVIGQDDIVYGHDNRPKFLLQYKAENKNKLQNIHEAKKYNTSQSNFYREVAEKVARNWLDTEGKATGGPGHKHQYYSKTLKADIVLTVKRTGY